MKKSKVSFNGKGWSTVSGWMEEKGALRLMELKRNKDLLKNPS